MLDDLGSGTLVDLTPWGIDEPTVQQSVLAGADLVCFSGDKMLGGPQCGIIVGKEAWIARLRKHPLARALRCDKITLAALSATLALYIEPEGWRRVPVLAMLTESLAEIEARARKLATALAGLPAAVEVKADISPVGGGALPLHQLETRVVQVRPRDRTAQDLAGALRQGRPPAVARVRDEAVLLDVRTLREEEIPFLAAALGEVMGGGDDE